MAAVTSLNKHKIVFGENEKNAKNIGSNLVERCQCLFLIRVCFLGMHDTLKKDSNVENLITFRKNHLFHNRSNISRQQTTVKDIRKVRMKRSLASGLRNKELKLNFFADVADKQLKKAFLPMSWSS